MSLFKLPSVPVRFGIVADCHYADRPAYLGRDCRSADRRLADCIAAFNALHLDFAVSLGDLKDDSGDVARTVAALEHVESVFATFDGPRYHVLGNHDMDVLSKEEVLSRISNTGFAKALPRYAFSRGGVRFLVLDANFNADGSDYCRGNFDWRIAVVPEKDKEWLGLELERSREPVVILCHQRLDTSDDLAVANASEIRAMLERSGKVVAVFTGHHHAGGFSRIGGIPYYTVKGLAETENSLPECAVVAEIAGGGVRVESAERCSNDIS